MNFEDTRVRLWVILSGAWILAAVALTTPISDELFGDYRGVGVMYIIFTFAALALSPFISIVHDWASPSDRLRWVHATILTLICGSTALILFNDGYSGPFWVAIAGWWSTFISSYFLIRAKREGVSQRQENPTDRDTENTAASNIEENPSAQDNIEFGRKGISRATKTFRHILRFTLAVLLLFLLSAISTILIQSASGISHSDAVIFGGFSAITMWILMWYFIIRRKQPVWQPGKRFWMRWLCVQLIGLPFTLIDVSGISALIIQSVLFILVITFLVDAVRNFGQYEIAKKNKLYDDLRRTNGLG